MRCGKTRRKSEKVGRRLAFELARGKAWKRRSLKGRRKGGSCFSQCKESDDVYFLASHIHYFGTTRINCNRRAIRSISQLKSIIYTFNWVSDTRSSRSRQHHKRRATCASCQSPNPSQTIRHGRRDGRPKLGRGSPQDQTSKASQDTVSSIVLTVTYSKSMATTGKQRETEHRSEAGWEGLEISRAIILSETRYQPLRSGFCSITMLTSHNRH
jgi:hypothetical protein